MDREASLEAATKRKIPPLSENGTFVQSVASVYAGPL
jgi:hypothetical protein